ncbi:MAG: hypothetical protein FJ405_13365 [Verrucomicrobia bacterium]|nr:hypothetical protein [Verrucomicrobiota bacterium]
MCFAEPQIAPFTPALLRSVVRARAGACAWLLAWMSWLLSILPLPATTSNASPQLTLTLQADYLALESSPAPGDVLMLELSDDLQTWRERAQTFGRIHPYPEERVHRFARFAQFYRLQYRLRLPSDDWVNQLDPKLPDLFKPGSGSGLSRVSSIKWTLMLADPGRVYFQDSLRYPFHIQFARARLPGYASMSVLDFNAQSLFPTSAQKMVLGSLFRAPDPLVREVGIEVTGNEAFPVERIADLLLAVRRRTALPDGWRWFYMPSTEQREAAEVYKALLTARGIEISSLGRWASENTCYSPGWALGRLVYLPASKLQSAIDAGDLRLGDVLVTDHIPAELPLLAGVIALEPATPNSHVALLARSTLTPFAYANGAGLQAEILSLKGREVLLVVDDTQGSCQISLKDTTGLLTEERRKQILDSKQSSLEVVPKARRGSYFVTVDDLTPADVRHVGGKAAHFGFLRRSLPVDSPHPVQAITFDLWDEFMEQPHAGTTLKEHIASMLSQYNYPPDVQSLRTQLAAIRSVIERQTFFTPAQEAAVVSALQSAGLQGGRIRFRSSTNVEDGDTFNGAGLYDSFSGCLEDDLDADVSGPSRCNPAESSERGVVRAIRKVYASFYNDNAVVERLRYRVDESKVGMAILVHFSVPDEEEMANGVATCVWDRSGPQRTATARIVSQMGAESVANPDVRIRPEIVRAGFRGTEVTDISLEVEDVSTLVPEGQLVMQWQADYEELISQMNAVAKAYEAYYPQKLRYELDFEFKKLKPGRVGLKQVRPVPTPTPVPVPIIP